MGAGIRIYADQTDFDDERIWQIGHLQIFYIPTQTSFLGPNPHESSEVFDAC
jgi:hypothetical protein